MEYTLLGQRDGVENRTSYMHIEKESEHWSVRDLIKNCYSVGNVSRLKAERQPSLFNYVLIEKQEPAWGSI